MIELEQLWQHELPPGLYHLTARRSPQRLCDEAAEHGFRCFYLNGLAVPNKAAFLDACAEAMQFPAYFGKNWDALHECIDDLSWVPAPRYLLFYDRAEIFAADHPNDWAIARTILRDTVTSWAKRDVPFYVLLRGWVATAGLPRYP